MRIEIDFVGLLAEEKVMKILLWVLAALSFIEGVTVYTQAESAVHQILANISMVEPPAHPAGTNQFFKSVKFQEAAESISQGQ